MGAVIAYGAEKQVTANSTLDFSVYIAVPQGVSLKIRLARANQNYVFQVREGMLVVGIGVRRGLYKGVEDGRRTPTRRTPAHSQGVKGLGMAGPSDT
jgi:hypothetical protein